MQTLNILLNRNCYGIFWNSEEEKLVIQKDKFFYNSFDNEESVNREDLILVFSISPYLIGIIKGLGIPFYKAKRRILSAINKDLKQFNILDRNSNLGNLLINDFGIEIS
jgi:hypothetical protein